MPTTTRRQANRSQESAFRIVKAKRTRRHENAHNSTAKLKVDLTSRRHRVTTSTNSTDSNEVHRANTTETVSEDDTCPICQQLLFNPVRTTCSHTLCEVCMIQWAETISHTIKVPPEQTTRPLSHGTRVLEQGSDMKLQARCPMCRTLTYASRDHILATRLQMAYPLAWAERASAGLDGPQSGSVQSVALEIGNKHELLPPVVKGAGDRHEWVFFVRPSRAGFVEEVQIQIHHSFRPSLVIRGRPPFEIRRIGDGEFTIVAWIILRPGYSWLSNDAVQSPDGVKKGMLPIEWMLDFTSFNGQGSMGRWMLKVANDREWSDDGVEEERDRREWQRTIRQYQRDGRYEPPVE